MDHSKVVENTRWALSFLESVNEVQAEALATTLPNNEHALGDHVLVPPSLSRAPEIGRKASGPLTL